MSLGKQIRLKRIFSHPSGRLCSVAVDHLLGYSESLPNGLLHLPKTLQAIMDGQPDAITAHKGVAASLWPRYAGQTALIIQSSGIRPDDVAMEQFATPEDAIRLGADGIAVAAFVRGKTEAHYLRVVADYVREASRYELPVFCHIYPRKFADGVSISYTPEDIAWATRCAVEVGADVVKTPFCGDIRAHREIAANCPVPFVAAGGPRSGSLREALQSMNDAVEGNALGATIGRNVWGFEQVTAALQAFKAVIHDRQSPEEAMRAQGLSA